MNESFVLVWMAADIIVRLGYNMEQTVAYYDRRLLNES